MSTLLIFEPWLVSALALSSLAYKPLLPYTVAEALLLRLHRCLSGDPGHNGSYGARLLSEKLGDLPAAIASYRRSSLPQVFLPADELQNILPVGNKP